MKLSQPSSFQPPFNLYDNNDSILWTLQIREFWKGYHQPYNPSHSQSLKVIILLLLQIRELLRVLLGIILFNRFSLLYEFILKIWLLRF